MMPLNRCVAAGFLLCLLHVLSWIALTHPSWVALTHPFRINVREEELKFVLIAYGIWLAPVVAVFLLRRSCALVAVLSVPIVVNFSVRMYYAWERFFFGPTSEPQNGHWSAWLMSFIGTVSLGIIAVWLLARIGMLVAGLIGARHNKS